MKRGFFIVGTDTNVGKTTIACALLKQLKTRGSQTLGLKPVASGCELTPEGLRNQDALMLQEASTLKLPYARINPFTFQEPIAPNIAAKKLGINLEASNILKACEKALASNFDIVLIEGAGGFYCPLNEKETFADLAKAFNLPLILIIPLRLGCLNQSLLTLDAIEHKNLKLAGWFANPIEPNMLMQDENLQFLKEKIQAPFLGLHPQCLLEELLLG